MSSGGQIHSQPGFLRTFSTAEHLKYQEPVFGWTELHFAVVYGRVDAARFPRR